VGQKRWREEPMIEYRGRGRIISEGGRREVSGGISKNAGCTFHRVKSKPRKLRMGGRREAIPRSREAKS